MKIYSFLAILAIIFIKMHGNDSPNKPQQPKQSATSLLNWASELLKLQITHIQQFTSGALYCQILDAIYPHKVPLNRVNWIAKNQYEFINNFKILSSSFDRLDISKAFDVQKLSKGNYHDNLHLLQWLKKYYENFCLFKDQQYKAQQRRTYTKVDLNFTQKIVTQKTFNANGQIQPLSKQKSTDRLPLSSCKNQTKSSSSIKNSQIINTSSETITIKEKTKLKNNNSSKQIHRNKFLQKSRQRKKPPLPVSIIVSPRTIKKQQNVNQLSQSQYRPRVSLQQVAGYKKKIRDLQTQLQTIFEIVHGKDNAKQKVDMIMQIFQLSKQNKSSEYVSNNNLSQFSNQQKENVQQQFYNIKVIPQNIISHQNHNEK